MVKIGFLFETKDPRLQELRRWTLELLPDAEFHFTDLKRKPQPSTNDPPESSDAAEPQKIDFILWNEAFCPLNEIRSVPEYVNTPVMAFVADSRLVDPTRPNLLGVDDILLLPTERLIYLQKLELLIAKSEPVTQAFLFDLKIESQDPRLRFDIGKSVQITHLSETACTVISPHPLVRGLEGTLACNVFWNERESTNWQDRLVEVRVQESSTYLDSNLASTQHSAEEPQPMKYEVRLRYFGLRQSQLRSLRLWLTKNLNAKWPEINRSDAKAKHFLRVALISPRDDVQTTLRSSLENLANVEIIRHQGLQSFLLDLKERGNSVPTQSPDPAGVTLPESGIPYHAEFVGPRRLEEMLPVLPTTKLKMRIRSDDLFIEKIEPTPAANSRILGHPLSVWEKGAGVLMQALNASDRSVLEETITWIANGRGAEVADRKSTLNLTYHPTPWIREKIETTLKLLTPREGQNSPQIELALNLEKSNSDSRAGATTRSDSSSQPYAHEMAQKEGLEAIMIDASLLRLISDDPELVRERFRTISEAIDKAALKNAFGNPPPLIMFFAENDFDPTCLRGTAVRQLIYRFEDRRYFAEIFISLSRPELWTSQGLAVAEFAADIDAAVFRPTKLESISEAGFRILDRIPLKTGTSVRVLSSIWSNRQQPTWAKIRRVQAQENLYQEDFVFLGVDDEIQKSIRNFGLQDHVNRKKSQQG